jgi:hypothetical protein
MMEPADRPTVHERRTFAPLRATLERLLDTFALVDGLPARRADDPALREAVRAARVANARVLLLLNRMEGHGDVSSAEIPARPEARALPRPDPPQGEE